MSFRREKFEPFGGPNGGDGGRGGDVVVEADENVSDLSAYRFRPRHQARNGEPGRGSDQHGKQGDSCVLKVPPGTLIADRETGHPVAEMMRHGDSVVLCKGGNGGWGNLRFKSSINRAPRQANDGQPGGEGVFHMVLKTIADVGLVGYPNAGKSSLMNLITKARPRTAAYPFTTLHPQVGVIEFPESHERVFLADIPGLIEGASENRGLGHRFLRHIERCHTLLLLIDMAATDQRVPADDYSTLLDELGKYSSELMEKPRLVAANKMDEEAASGHLADFRARHPGVDVLPISCLSEEGVPELKQLLLKAARARKAAEAAQAEAEAAETHSETPAT